MSVGATHVCMEVADTRLERKGPNMTNRIKADFFGAIFVSVFLMKDVGIMFL